MLFYMVSGSLSFTTLTTTGPLPRGDPGVARRRGLHDRGDFPGQMLRENPHDDERPCPADRPPDSGGLSTQWRAGNGAGSFPVRSPSFHRAAVRLPLADNETAHVAIQANRGDHRDPGTLG